MVFFDEDFLFDSWEMVEERVELNFSIFYVLFAASSKSFSFSYRQTDGLAKSLDPTNHFLRAADPADFFH